MKRFSSVGKRVAMAAAAVAVAGLGISSAAFASSASSGRPAPAPVPACTAADLGAWVASDQGNGAAGSIYFPLQFTNLTRHACSMRGFPGVSAVNRLGRELGSPASREYTSVPRTVVLAPGATVHAILRWSDVAVTTEPGCDPTYSAAQLRIYPPGQYQATYTMFSLEVCSHPGANYMSIGPVIPGVGTING
jgi:Protein of unknown function (DUF4232)